MYVNNNTTIGLFFFVQKYPAWKWISVTLTRPANTRKRWRDACAIQDIWATEQRAVVSVLSLFISFSFYFSFAHFARLRTLHETFRNVNGDFFLSINLHIVHIAFFAFRITKVNRKIDDHDRALKFS